MREEYSELKEENIIAAPKFYLGYHVIVIGKEYIWDIQRGYFERTDGKYETRNNVIDQIVLLWNMKIQIGPKCYKNTLCL